MQTNINIIIKSLVIEISRIRRGSSNSNKLGEKYTNTNVRQSDTIEYRVPFNADTIE